MVDKEANHEGAESGPWQDIDRRLAVLGFERTSPFGRVAWRGQYEGRLCVISVAAQGRTRYVGEVRVRQRVGYRLRVELQTNVVTQLFFVREALATSVRFRLIYRLRRLQVLDTVVPELAGFRAVTFEPEWAERLLGQSQAMSTTAHLLKENAAPKLAGSVYFLPGKAHYGSPVLQLDQITPERVFDGIARLEEIVQTAEGLPAPVLPWKPNALERLNQENPRLASALAVAAFFVVGLGGLALAAVILVVLAVLISQH